MTKYWISVRAVSGGAFSDDIDLGTMSRALLKMRSGRCHVYSTSSCCFVKHLFV
jgi:hypothetical protein